MRNKLKLNLNELRVDSFDTSADARAQRGTVQGNEYCCCCCCYPCCCGGTVNTQCGQASCGGTCGASCYGTCYEATCAASCANTCNCPAQSDYCGTQYDATCNNYGTCNWGGRYACADIP